MKTKCKTKLHEKKHNQTEKHKTKIKSKTHKNNQKAFKTIQNNKTFV